MGIFHSWISFPQSDAASWLQALLVLCAVWFAGFTFRKIASHYLSRWASKTSTQLDDIVVRASRFPLLFWFLLLGIFLGAKTSPLDPAAVVFAGRALSALFIVSLTFLAASIASQLIAVYGKKISLSLPLTSLTENLIRIIIVGLGLLILLSHLGISITPLLTALGVGSLAVALALQDTLSNLFAGFYILASRQFRPGDYIKVDSGQEGYIMDIGWRATRIRQLSNNVILIPNAKIGQAIVTNYTLQEQELAVLVQVGVSYASDLEHVEKVTVEVARGIQNEVPGAIRGFEPFIRYHTFGDSAVQFTVILRSREFVDQYLLKHEFIKRLHRRYRKENIEIPFPQRVMHVPPAPPAAKI